MIYLLTTDIHCLHPYFFHYYVLGNPFHRACDSKIAEKNKRNQFNSARESLTCVTV